MSRHLPLPLTQPLLPAHPLPLTLLLLCCACAHAEAPPSAPPLRVCADPNHLPYSDAQGRGLEDAVARVLARELHRPLEHAWHVDRRGFLRETLQAGACDVALTVIPGTPRVLTTRPWMRSTYVLVQRSDAPAIESLDDPRLKALRIGVQLVGADGRNTPPVHALDVRGLVDNEVGFFAGGDYRNEAPGAEVLQAVADRRVDVALVWGPIAGWGVAKKGLPLALRPLKEPEAPPGQTFSFSFAAAVRKDDAPLRDALDAVLASRADEVRAILREFGVPEAAP